jgi:hypothetical protein
MGIHHVELLHYTLGPSYLSNEKISTTPPKIEAFGDVGR